MEDKNPVAHTPNAQGAWHYLQEHLEDVATKARRYADKFGAGELGYYAGLWHDIGKYNPKFQIYLEQCHTAANSGNTQHISSVPHAIHGAKLAWEVLMPLAPIIYGHHRGLPELQQMKNKLFEPDLEESYQEVLQQARQNLSQLQPDTDLAPLIAGLVKDAHSYELLTRILFSCLVDADYLDTEEHFDLNIAKQRGSTIQIKDLWAMLQAKQEQLLSAARDTTLVNQVRAEVYHACIGAAKQPPGVFRLAVPTGGGKTRSGLAFALQHSTYHKLARVIIAVPYTSIIEQTVGVYREIFGESAVLEHHSAINPDEANESNARRLWAQARLATQNWDAPLIVTTTVQLFESLFANRLSRCRKLHNIIGSVIVLDEVQTLPTALLDPILSVLRELIERYRVTVVLCTATQPALEGESPYLKGFTSGTVRDIVPQEIAKQHFLTLNRVDYEALPNSWSWQQLMQDVQDRNYIQALIVLNTRKDALSVLDEAQALFKDVNVFHLSTLLCGAHRRQVLETVRERLRREEPCLLVSTQAVEAGVDLDFPVVYRALGPLDRIVQAAGRCNREGKMQGKGRVVIFQPQEGKVPLGEYKTAVDETTKLLQQQHLDLNNPSIFENYFRDLYQGVCSDKHDIQRLRASFNYPKVAEKFKSIASDTTAVVIQYDNHIRALLQQIQIRGLFSRDHRALQPYLVNLRDREFKQADGLREEIAPSLWVWHGNYDAVKGIGIGNRAISYDPADLIQ